MPPRYYRLRVHARVQVRDQPADVQFFSGPGEEGFPGVQIPAALCKLIGQLDGSTLLLTDPGQDSGAAAREIQQHFEAVTGKEGPPGARWTLDKASWTIEGTNLWIHGLEAVAFQLSYQQRSPGGDFVAAAPRVQFQDVYELDPAQPLEKVVAHFWLCF